MEISNIPGIESHLDIIAIKNFTDYLKIKTVHPDVDYDEAVEFLKQQALTLGLPVDVLNVAPNKPIVIITWKGSEPSLPSILLNSHMDVVPVFKEQWTYPPFEAKIDKNGDIYARGTQDMKSVGIQYLEAIRRMQRNSVKIKRTIHVVFVPDEEINGVEGMQKFVKTDEFKSLNVGFAMDEGMTSLTQEYKLFYGEKCSWKVRVKCFGNAGHGSLLLDNTAGEKLRVILDRFLDFRTEQKDRLSNPNINMGDVTSVNLTQIEGGVQSNVIPNEISAIFDIRLSPGVKHEEFEGLLKKWCEEAGEGVCYDFLWKNNYVENTKLDKSNPYWVAFKKACDEEELELDLIICPGAADGRYLREHGIPVIGFSPINMTHTKLHDHDEYLNVNVFLRGIQIYQRIIKEIANF